MGLDHSKVVKKVLKKNIFVFLGNPLNREKKFEIFFLPMNSIYPYEDIDTSLKLIGHVCEAQ